jgi:hypothetical protein
MIQKGRAHLQRESQMRRDRHYGGTFNCKSGGVQFVRITEGEVEQAGRREETRNDIRSSLVIRYCGG